jgi:predicted nucleic acid-binding protein
VIGLLDACVAIDLLRGHPGARAAMDEVDFLAASEVMRFELLAGMRPAEEEETEELMALLGWLPVGEEIARLAGALARRYRPSNSGIDDADYLIAATALHYEATLLTTNVRHFPMLEGLQPAY